MKIAVGAPGWYDACSPDERATTVALAASRWKWSVVWSGLAATGVFLTLLVIVGEFLPLPWPADTAPRGALLVALCSLLLDLAVLLPNSVAWLRVGQVFSGNAPEAVVRPFRRLRWVPTSLVSLFGTVAMLMAGIHPLARYGEAGIGGLSLDAWLTAGVAVLCVVCGLSTMWLKVILRPVRTGR